MSSYYKIHEARFLQEASVVSAADALFTSLGPVPPNKVWTVLRAHYHPSANETQIITYCVLSRASTNFPVTIPTSVALTALSPYPVVTEGNELLLFPGEYLVVRRVAGTAGSTMTLVANYIESDLPLYDYVEPQEELRLSKFKRGVVNTIGSSAGASGSRPSGGGGPTSGGAFGGSRPK